jgi:hypothetical protein
MRHANPMRRRERAFYTAHPAPTSLSGEIPRNARRPSALPRRGRDTYNPRSPHRCDPSAASALPMFLLEHDAKSLRALPGATVFAMLDDMAGAIAEWHTARAQH